MGKFRHQAASVSWSEMEAAIRTNPHRSCSLQGGAASASLSALPSEAALAWFPGWTEDETFTVKDPVALSLWVRDPLYRVAAPAIRRSMEMEEAAFLLHSSETAWKQHNGRVRSWVRKHLEEDLRLRAGGGDPAPDAWEAIRTTKRAALLLDYICIMRGIRVALWWPDHKAVTVIPLTGSAPTTTVSQLNCLSGRMLIGPASELTVPPSSWPALLLKASSEIAWTPPASAPSIGTNTVAQIHDRIQALLKEPDVLYVRTGGRTGLWTRLLWLTLVDSLNGKEPEQVAEMKQDTLLA
jgi:hypothetical protein